MTAPLDLRPPSSPVNLYTGQDYTIRVVGLPTGTYTARQVTGADQTPVGDPLSCTADGDDWLVVLPASRRLPHSRIQLADATEVVLELVPTWLARGAPGPATRTVTVTVTSGASPTLEIVVQGGPSIVAERARAEDAEVALGVRVDAEATSRANADTAEVTNRNTAIAVHAAATDPHGDRAYTLAQIAVLTGGAPGTLDSFLEAYNRFLADEDAVAALTAIVSGKQPSSAQLTALAALTTTPFGRHLLELADGPAVLGAIGAQSAGTYLQGLVPTAVKTTNYAAAVNDLVPVDTTSGAVTVTLPTAPADKTVVAVKHVTRGGTNVVTVAAGGSDVFNKTAGATTLTVTLLNQAVILQYKASGGIWYVLADDLSLAQLDVRFQAAGTYLALVPSAATRADIQAILDAVPVTGGDIYFSGAVNASVDVSLKVKDLTRVHVGSARLKLAAGANTDIWRNADFYTGNTGILIEGGNLDGNRTNQATGNGSEPTFASNADGPGRSLISLLNANHSKVTHVIGHSPWHHGIDVANPDEVDGSLKTIIRGALTGTISAPQLITGATSGAVGTVVATGVDSRGANYIVIDTVTGTFQAAETVTTVTGSTTVTTYLSFLGSYLNTVGEFCEFWDCGDDGITTHFAHSITISNFDVHDAAATYSASSNGVEVDDGSWLITVLGGRTFNCVTGIAVQGHSGRTPATDVMVIGTIAKSTTGIATGFSASQPTTANATTPARGVSFIGCQSYGMQVDFAVLNYTDVACKEMISQGTVYEVFRIQETIPGTVNSIEIGGGSIKPNSGATKIAYHNTATADVVNVRGVAGIVTEANGVATIPSGSTSVVILHGLERTPTARDIQVTPTNSLGSATKWWVSATSATQIVLTVDVDPGAVTAMFAWAAMVTARGAPVLPTAQAYWKASTYDPVLDALTDLSGHGLHAVFGSSVGADAADPKWLDFASGGQYVYFPGISGNYVSTPDSAAVSPTGNVSLRAAIAPDVLASGGTQTLISKYGAAGQRSFDWYLTTTGFLELVWSILGTNVLVATATAITPVANGALILVRTDLVVDNGATQNETKFYTKTSTEATAAADLVSDTGWTQLGATVTKAAVSSIFDSTTKVSLGCRDDLGDRFTGKMYGAYIVNAGTPAALFDARDAAPPFASCTGSYGNVWTFTRTGTGKKLAVVDRALLLLGTASYLEVPDDSTLDFAASDSFSLVVAVRAYGSPTNQVFLAKRTGLTSGAGYVLDLSGATLPRFEFGDGTVDVSGGDATVLVDGIASVFVGTRDGTSKKTIPYLNGAPGTQRTDSSTGTLANSEVLRLGRLSGAGTSYFGGEIIGAAVFRRKLTTAEVIRLQSEFLV